MKKSCSYIDISRNTPADSRRVGEVRTSPQKPYVHQTGNHRFDGLPKSDVLKFLLEDNCSIVIRPSGTEPKLKMYISVSAEDKEAAEKTEEEISRSAEEYLNVPKMDIRNPR